MFANDKKGAIKPLFQLFHFAQINKHNNTERYLIKRQK